MLYRAPPAPPVRGGGGGRVLGGVIGGVRPGNTHAYHLARHSRAAPAAPVVVSPPDAGTKRTPKFFYAAAACLPVYSPGWVRDSCREGRLQPLGFGTPHVLDRVTWGYGGRHAELMARGGLFRGRRALVVGGEAFVAGAAQLLGHAGAEVEAAAAAPPRQLLQQLGKGTKFDFVLVDDAPAPEASAVSEARRRAEAAGVPVFRKRWLKACLLQGSTELTARLD